MDTSNEDLRVVPSDSCHYRREFDEEFSPMEPPTRRACTTTTTTTTTTTVTTVG